MDISKFFDEIDHEIMLKAVAHVLPEKWVLMYVKRWLEMPVQEKDGNIRSKEGKWTPQRRNKSTVREPIFTLYIRQMI